MKIARGVDEFETIKIDTSGFHARIVVEVRDDIELDRVAFAVGGNESNSIRRTLLSLNVNDDTIAKPRAKYREIEGSLKVVKPAEYVHLIRYTSQ